MMTFGKTLCCGISEISGLCGQGSPESAMVSFCSSQLETGIRFGSNTTPKLGQLYSHYLFTAAIYPHRNDGSWYSSYGDLFKKFIEENNLGTVVETPTTVNEAFHKDHSVKAYMWTPNREQVVEWWAKHGLDLKIKAAEDNLKQYAHYLEIYPGDKWYQQDFDKAKKALNRLLKEQEQNIAALKAEPVPESAAA